MNYKITFNKICELLIYLYIIIVMLSISTGAAFVKIIRVILFLFLMIYFFREKKIYKSWYCKWAIIFLLFNIVMIRYSYSKTISIYYTYSLAYVLVINILICQFIIKNKIYRKLFEVIAVGATLRAFYVFISSGFFAFLNSRVEGSANLIGLYCSIAFSLCYFLKKTSNGKRNAFYNTLEIFNCIFVVLSASRKAILFLILPILFYLISKNKNPIKLFFSIIIVLFFVFIIYELLMNIEFLYQFVGHRIESMISGFSGGKTDSSTSTRMILIEDGIKWFKQKPWVGYGPAVYRVLHADAYYGNLLYAHNNYIELLVDLGLIGTVLYYILYVKLLLKSIICSIKINKKYFILVGIILSFIIGEYGLVTYYDAIFQLILMIFLLYFETIQRGDIT